VELLDEMPLTQASTTITLSTSGPGFMDLTAHVEDWLGQIGAREGLLTVYLRHTSASLTIQENSDPDVRRDLLDALDRLAPRSQKYRHRLEGTDDMPAHIKSALTATSIGIPVVNGRAVFGTWQALYLIEHRDIPHRREVVLHFMGEVRST